MPTRPAVPLPLQLKIAEELNAGAKALDLRDKYHLHHATIYRIRDTLAAEMKEEPGTKPAPRPTAKEEQTAGMPPWPTPRWMVEFKKRNGHNAG